MNKDVRRLLNLIAALDLPRDELVSLVYEFKHLSIEEVVSRVRLIDTKLSGRRAVYEESVSPPRRLSSYYSDFTIGDRVDRLLREEAGVGTGEAVEQLADLLVQVGLVSLEDIPPLSRKSFKDWVNRLANLVPEKDILRYATVLRNKYVNGPESDWKLRG